MSELNLTERLKQQEELNRDVLEACGKIIEAQINKEGYTPVVRCEMGRVGEQAGSKSVTSYIGTRTIKDLSNDSLFKLGVEMDFMKDSFDEKGHFVVDQNNSEELAQRAPDYSRQISMTSYLLRNKYRKFGTILVVVSPKWVNDPNHENWDKKTGRAKKTSIEFQQLIPLIENVGVIDVGAVNVYALDGQHRLLGMRGLKEVDAGRIFPKTKNNEPKKEPIEKEQFLQLNNCTNSDLADIFDETVTVEYLPAVIEGETMQEAKRRVRSVFVAINKNAKKPVAGETIILDEDDGFAIVARQIGRSHRMFQVSNSEGRVNWKNISIPKRSHWIITLQHLRTMAEDYLKFTRDDLVSFWKNNWGFQRPEENEISDAHDELAKFLDNLMKLPSFKRIMACHKGDDLDTIRLEETNILTRPIGFTILASAVGQLLKDGAPFDQVFEKLTKFDEQGGFEQNKETGIWWCVTSDPRGRMLTSNQSVAADLIKWKLYGQTYTDGPELSDKVRALRVTDDGTEYWSFDGTKKPYSPDSDLIDLPDTII